MTGKKIRGWSEEEEGWRSLGEEITGFLNSMKRETIQKKGEIKTCVFGAAVMDVTEGGGGGGSPREGQRANRSRADDPGISRSTRCTSTLAEINRTARRLGGYFVWFRITCIMTR